MGQKIFLLHFYSLILLVLLTNENRKQYASYFFAHFLGKDYDEIYNSIKFVKTELDKDIDSERAKRVDFICKLDNEYVLLEMNNKSSASVLERNIMYTAKIYGHRKKKKEKENNENENEKKYQYNRVISINLNNFNFKGNKKVVQKFLFKDDDGKVYTNKIQIYNIYLPLIKKKYYNGCKLSKFEEILLIFNENNEKLLNKLSEDDVIMKEYIKEATDASADGEWAALEYDKELHDMMIQNELIDEAKEAGLKAGKKIGIEERNLEIAKNLLKKKIDISIVSECTGLSMESIKKLG